MPGPMKHLLLKRLWLGNDSKVNLVRLQGQENFNASPRVSKCCLHSFYRIVDMLQSILTATLWHFLCVYAYLKLHADVLVAFYLQTSWLRLGEFAQRMKKALAALTGTMISVGSLLLWSSFYSNTSPMLGHERYIALGL